MRNGAGPWACPCAATWGEVRSSLPGKRIARVLICHHDDCLVALHGLSKKTRATPDDDLALTRKRHKELT